MLVSPSIILSPSARRRSQACRGPEPRTGVRTLPLLVINSKLTQHHRRFCSCHPCMQGGSCQLATCLESPNRPIWVTLYSYTKPRCLANTPPGPCWQRFRSTALSQHWCDSSTVIGRSLTCSNGVNLQQHAHCTVPAAASPRVGWVRMI